MVDLRLWIVAVDLALAVPGTGLMDGWEQTQKISTDPKGSRLDLEAGYGMKRGIRRSMCANRSILFSADLADVCFCATRVLLMVPAIKHGLYLAWYTLCRKTHLDSHIQDKD